MRRSLPAWTKKILRVALLSSVISIAPDAIISVDNEQRIILFNEGAEQTFGYRRDEVLGHPLGILLPERYRAAHAEHIRKFGTSREAARLMGERQEIFALHKDGREFPAEAAICKLELDHHRVFTVLLRDVTERKRREQHNQLLMRELEHRVRNLLARVQILIERGADGQVSLREFQETLLARIKSMVRAHELLGRTNWHGVTVADLIADQLRPYATNHNIRVEGPQIVLNADATQALSMVFHELATNAVKYGALSVPTGRVKASWQRTAGGQENGEALVLRWTEHGGPSVKAPQRAGYGTALIRELLTFGFGGKVDLQYAPHGVKCEISLPLERVLAEPQ